MNEYDALLAMHNANPQEGSVLGVLADYLEENGKPGAKLARAGMDTVKSGLAHNLQHTNYGSTTGIGQNIDESGERMLHDARSSLYPYGQIVVHPHHIEGRTVPAYIRVAHSTSDGSGITPDYRVPVRSIAELHELTSDLSTAQAAKVHEFLEPHLPPTHVEHYARQITEAMGKL